MSEGGNFLAKSDLSPVIKKKGKVVAHAGVNLELCRLGDSKQSNFSLSSTTSNRFSVSLTSLSIV